MSEDKKYVLEFLLKKMIQNATTGGSDIEYQKLLDQFNDVWERCK